ncbi:VOC family protein [Ramlibacter aurantiacus]|nr:VOC family protein [Ramlibacter aurantiacus]
MAAFYGRAFGMQVAADAGLLRCTAPEREVSFSEGQAQQLGYALFRFDHAADWSGFLDRIAARPTADASQLPGLPDGARLVRDPDGTCLAFFLAGKPADRPAPALPPACGQHFALRTQRIDEMVAFYADVLGFVVSDRVRDAQGRLTACFLRTHDLHHSLALFSAPVTCFDHQSFETPNWGDLKTWADHMAHERIEIVWGVGRHGPGNDAFFMVRDPDGNLAEISTEIEVCEADRPAGSWRHEERTLNLWGKAILRS